MALSAAFKERLDQMEFTRNQRLHLLQAEKELQMEKSQILASKHASIQFIERRCLMLEQKIAAQNLKITLLRSTIQDLDSKHHRSIQKLRFVFYPLHGRELDEERDKYYKLKRSEMNEFVQNVERFRSENRVQVESLRRRVKETSGGFSGYGYSNSSPDRYTVGLNFPDIGSSSRHDDSKVCPWRYAQCYAYSCFIIACNIYMYMQINTHYFCYVGEQEVNEITESVREVNRGLPQWKISRLPTHTYGETPTCGWWWEKKKRFVADDSQYVVCANARSAVK
ncbi:unnamed protein product [Brassica oleracea]